MINPLQSQAFKNGVKSYTYVKNVGFFAFRDNLFEKLSNVIWNT